jgi:hypothetical protein
MTWQKRTGGFYQAAKTITMPGKNGNIPTKYGLKNGTNVPPI